MRLYKDNPFHLTQNCSHSFLGSWTEASCIDSAASWPYPLPQEAVCSMAEMESFQTPGDYNETAATARVGWTSLLRDSRSPGVIHCLLPQASACQSPPMWIQALTNSMPRTSILDLEPAPWRWNRTKLRYHVIWRNEGKEYKTPMATKESGKDMVVNTWIPRPQRMAQLEGRACLAWPESSLGTSRHSCPVQYWRRCPAYAADRGCQRGTTSLLESWSVCS